jgi:hypothetical protein
MNSGSSEFWSLSYHLFSMKCQFFFLILSIKRSGPIKFGGKGLNNLHIEV